MFACAARKLGVVAACGAAAGCILNCPPVMSECFSLCLVGSIPAYRVAVGTMLAACYDI